MEALRPSTTLFRSGVGGADKFQERQELIYAFIRGPDSGRRTLLSVRKKTSAGVRTLGCASTKQLGRWGRIHEEKADLPKDLKPGEHYSRTQKITAVEHYLTYGAYTLRDIG